MWALQVLRYKVPGFPLRDVLASLGRMVVAAAVAGEVRWLGRRSAATTAGPALAPARRRVVVGLVVYIGVLLALRAPS